VCEDEELFEKEIMLLKGKRQAGDDSVKQTVKTRDNEGKYAHQSSKPSRLEDSIAASNISYLFLQ
jgi:hypothetical protein